MNKVSQTLPLQALLSAVINFNQNMKILYNELYKNSGKSKANKIIFDAYHPLLNNIAASGSLNKNATFEQIQKYIQYLIGIIRPLVSSNVLSTATLSSQYGQIEGVENLDKFGKTIQNMFVPLATSLEVPADATSLIEKAPQFSDLLNKVGANLNTYVRKYMSQLAVAERVDLLMKWSTLYYQQSEK